MQAKLSEKAKRRGKAQDAKVALEEDGWAFLNSQELNKKYHFSYESAYSKYATIESCPDSLGEIFDVFLPQMPIQQIREDIPEDCWRRKGHLNERVVPRMSYIYKVLASYIYIAGHRGVVPGVAAGKLDQNKSVQAARRFLTPHAPLGSEKKFPGVDVCNQILSNYHIPYTKFEEISINFQTILGCIGEVAAGDEKLFHFTGDSLLVRSVPDKPDRIGMWLYELCVRMEDGGSYLIRMRWYDASSKLGTSVPVLEVVEDWVNIILNDDDANTLLVFDNYYYSQGVRNLLVEKEVLHIAACKDTSFRDMITVMEPRVQPVGSYAIAWKEDTSEIFVAHHHADARLGLRYCGGTAYQKVNNKAPIKQRYIIPGSDLYNVAFDVCDKFNTNINKHKYPHKGGGRGRMGDESPS